MKICKVHGEVKEMYVDKQGKCRFCKAEYNRNYYKKKMLNKEEREKFNLRKRKYREKRKSQGNPIPANYKVYHESNRKYQKKIVANLSDAYCKRKLVRGGANPDCITPELIALKRSLLKLKRTIKEKK